MGVHKALIAEGWGNVLGRGGNRPRLTSPKPRLGQHRFEAREFLDPKVWGLWDPPLKLTANAFEEWMVGRLTTFLLGFGLFSRGKLLVSGRVGAFLGNFLSWRTMWAMKKGPKKWLSVRNFCWGWNTTQLYIWGLIIINQQKDPPC